MHCQATGAIAASLSGSITSAYEPLNPIPIVVSPSAQADKVKKPQSLSSGAGVCKT